MTYVARNSGALKTGLVRFGRYGRMRETVHALLGDETASLDPSSITTAGTGTAPGDKTVSALQAQLNRFAASGAGRYKIFQSELEVTGVMDAATATRASQVLVFRASTLLLEGKGAGIGDQLGQETMDAATFSGMDPVAWATKNLPQIATVITGFANSRGLPKAELVVLGFPVSHIALAAAGLIGLVVLVKGRK